MMRPSPSDGAGYVVKMEVVVVVREFVKRLLSYSEHRHGWFHLHDLGIIRYALSVGPRVERQIHLVRLNGIATTVLLSVVCVM